MDDFELITEGLGLRVRVSGCVAAVSSSKCATSRGRFGLLQQEPLLVSSSLLAPCANIATRPQQISCIQRAVFVKGNSRMGFRDGFGLEVVGLVKIPGSYIEAS